MQKRKRPRWVKELAKRFIDRMLELAMAEKNKSLSSRYVKIALLASRKYNVRVDKDIKRRICKKCYSIMTPGRNAIVRVERNSIVWICGECGNVKRYGKPKKSGKKSKTSGKNRKKRVDKSNNVRGKKAPRHKRNGENKGLKS